MKQVDLEEVTPVLDQMGCTSRECKTNMKIIKGNQNSVLVPDIHKCRQIITWHRLQKSLLGPTT